MWTPSLIEPISEFPGATADGHHPAVILDLDYWLLMGRR